MSLTSTNIASWEDIKLLFNRVKAERDRFYLTSDISTTNPGIIKASQVTNLKDLINDMGVRNSFLASIASTSAVIGPEAFSVLKPERLNSLSNILTNIENTTITKTTNNTFHNASYTFHGNCTGFNSSTFFSTFNSNSFDGTFHNSFGSGDSSFSFCTRYGTRGTSGPSCPGFNSRRTEFGTFENVGGCSTHNGSRMSCSGFGFDNYTGLRTGFGSHCGSFTNGETCGTFRGSNMQCTAGVHLSFNDCFGGMFFSDFCNGFDGAYGTGDSAFSFCTSYTEFCTSRHNFNPKTCSAFNAPHYATTFYAGTFSFCQSGFNSQFNVSGFCTSFNGGTFLN